MAETAPVINYAGKKPRKPKKTAMPKTYKKKKAMTGGTKHVVSSTGGSL